jgi:hypothetical protein
VTGNGSIVISATDGSFPAETPNTAFQPGAEGGTVLTGTLSSDATATLSWVAPQTPGTVYITIFDFEDNVLDECSIDVVTADVSGNLGALGGSGRVPGDGTGIVDVDSAIVLRAIANPTGFSGDASGGPEANAPDYGYEPETAGEDSGDGDEEEAAAAVTEEDGGAPSGAELGPSTGANGMVALSMDRGGGALENPAGARITVPNGALDDATTVMIEPVPDHELPQIDGITLIPGTAFDVSFSQADGQAADPLDEPALLTIALGSAGSGEGARIYRIDGASAKPMPVSADDAGSVTTEVTELSRYVIGVPAPVVAASTRPFNPFVVGALAVMALISAGLLISRGLFRRKTRIIPVRRPMPTNRVRYR